MKTFHILQTVRRVPAGLMFVPLVLGALLNTFVPQALEIGTPFSALFSSKGTMCLIALALFFSGSQLVPSQIRMTLKRGGTLAFCKLFVSIGASAVFCALFGKEGVWGISSLALTVSLTSLLPAIYIGLMEDYGDEIDRAAYGIFNVIMIRRCRSASSVFPTTGDFHIWHCSPQCSRFCLECSLAISTRISAGCSNRLGPSACRFSVLLSALPSI